MFLSNDYQEILEHAHQTLPIPDGYQVLLKVFTPDEKQHGIIITEESREKETYMRNVGLVVGKGPVAYKKFNNEKNIYEEWHQCEIGEWVIFRPTSGTFFKYRDIPLRSVSDESILLRTKNPELVTRD